MTEKKTILLTTINQSKELPLALYYLKAYAYKFEDIKNNYEITIQDFQKKDTSLKDIIQTIISIKPQIIGFSCYIWNIKEILEVCVEIKKHCKKTSVWLGGPDVSEEYLHQEGVDLIIFGEGEETFYELLDYSLKDKDIKKIKGVAYKKENEIYKNPSRELINDIDTIPSPFLTGIADLKTLKKYDYLLFETRRGCTFKCAFCKESVKSNIIRYFSLERLEKEFDFLLKNNLFIEIIDPFLNTSKDRLIKICKIIEKRNKNNIVWVPLIYNILNEETVLALKKANMNRVEIGLQSTNLETLKNINKPINLELFKEKILLFDDYFTVHIDLIIGLPGDDFFKFVETLKFTSSLNKKILIELLSVDNNTPLRNNAKKFKMTFQKEAPYHIIANHSFSENEVKKALIMSKSFMKEYAIDL
ncbi:MAG: radical SAM protein [Nanoarchaeota archaeon]|nr:cobalamin-dependent protein [Nanoarchaeota archaeon]